MEAQHNGTDCPPGREGERQGAKRLHIQAANFLTNYWSLPLSKWAVSLSSLTLLRGIAVKPGKVPALRATQVALKRAKGAVTETVTSCLNTEQEMSNSD